MHPGSLVVALCIVLVTCIHGATPESRGHFSLMRLAFPGRTSLDRALRWFLVGWFLASALPTVRFRPVRSNAFNPKAVPGDYERFLK